MKEMNYAEIVYSNDKAKSRGVNMKLQINKKKEIIGVEIDSDKDKCSYLNCNSIPTIATISKDKIKGLSLEKIHYWCDIHYKMIKQKGEELI